MIVRWRFMIALPLGLVLGISVFVGLLYTQLGIPTASSQWIFDISQKKEQLAANVSGPRLLVVAGSGALFGINAQLIQKQTGIPPSTWRRTPGCTWNISFIRSKKWRVPATPSCWPASTNFTRTL